MKRLEKILARRRRAENLAAFVESLKPKPAPPILPKPEYKYFFCGGTDGGNPIPPTFNLNRYTWDTYFYTLNGKIAGGNVYIRVAGKREYFGCPFSDWNHKYLLEDGAEITKEEWIEWQRD